MATKKGIIHELGERSSGFIRQIGIKDHVFFHADALINLKFPSLKKGDKVCFTIVESKKGPYAIEVTKG